MTRRSGVTISPEAHAALRALAGLASGLAERPVSMSEALVAVLPVARASTEAYRTALAAERAD